MVDCAISFMSYAVFNNIKSYLSFFAAFVIYAAAGLLLGFWGQSTLWRRYIILVAGYATATICVLLFTVIIDYFGLISYFDGDAAGSFGMCYIPSIVFYALL